ncbi:MAG: DNA polymerase III subunit chi [Alphaproteobacteria bacterium]|nr:DNA polymerase III subunit chi [Alphaproteobacteria bacterium]
MRVDFYHLQKQVLEDVLPKLIEKAYSTGKRIKIKIGTEQRIEFINSLLWTYNEESFLPHGSKKDGFADLQPIWLTEDDKNPNDAKFLFLVDGANVSQPEVVNFQRVFNIFDGNNADELAKARNLWKELKSLNSEIYYWQQDNTGRWVEK